MSGKLHNMTPAELQAYYAEHGGGPGEVRRSLSTAQTEERAGRWEQAKAGYRQGFETADKDPARRVDDLEEAYLGLERVLRRLGEEAQTGPVYLRLVAARAEESPPRKESWGAIQLEAIRKLAGSVDQLSAACRALLADCAAALLSAPCEWQLVDMAYDPKVDVRGTQVFFSEIRSLGNHLILMLGRDKGLEDEDTAKAIEIEADALRLLGRGSDVLRWDGCAIHYRRLIAVREAGVGQRHPDTLRAWLGLAECIREGAQDQSEEGVSWVQAETICRRLLATLQAETAKQPLLMGRICECLGRCLEMQYDMAEQPAAVRQLVKGWEKKQAEAEIFYREALRHCDSAGAFADRSAVDSANFLAEIVLKDPARRDEAAGLFEDALRRCEQRGGKEAWPRRKILQTLASLATARGDLSAARTFLTSELEIVTGVYSEFCGETLALLERLVALGGPRAMEFEARAKTLREMRDSEDPLFDELGIYL